ncbi:MAG: ATP-binding cassette domain-containing protein [candidate division KSB1 bacterium]|jgi:energy-coupling factor transport system ATP-binding protein|nr:ATP-binding cassette domain-containing protein [candidate division KSB1 bacterium]
MNIEFESISFRYENKLPTSDMVINDISLNVGPGEFIGIVGPSGSGKTTLLQHFTGLLKPSAGRVLADGNDIFSKGFNQNRLRRKVGVVFQFPESQIFEETVYDDIAFGPRNFFVEEMEIERRAVETCRILGLDLQSLRNRSPFNLSEGEKRRVALAGIVVMDPEILVLDEPTACLDASGVRQVRNMLAEMFGMGKTIVLVSHDLDFVARMCRRIVALKSGVVIFDGEKQAFFKNRDLLNRLGFREPKIYRYYNKINAMLKRDNSSASKIDEIMSVFGVLK